MIPMRWTKRTALIMRMVIVPGRPNLRRRTQPSLSDAELFNIFESVLLKIGCDRLLGEIKLVR